MIPISRDGNGEGYILPHVLLLFALFIQSQVPFQLLVHSLLLLRLTVSPGPLSQARGGLSVSGQKVLT